jgi:hypothetical protein
MGSRAALCLNAPAVPCKKLFLSRGSSTPLCYLEIWEYLIVPNIVGVHETIVKPLWIVIKNWEVFISKKEKCLNYFC